MSNQTPAQKLALQCARLVSIALHPFLIGPAGVTLILYLDGDDIFMAAGWAALCTAFVVVPAILYLGYKLIRQQLTDADVSVREHRRSFYIFGAACMIVCFAILWWLDAPRALIIFFVSGLITLAAFAITNHLWTKVSVHTGAVAGIAGALTAFSLPLSLVGLIVTGLVIWSRLTLKRHRPIETATGLVIAYLTFAAGMAFA